MANYNKKGDKMPCGKKNSKENNIACKYKEEYGQQMLDYFNELAGKGYYPTFELFAVSIDVVSSTLRNWKKMYPQFSEFYNKCEELQVGAMKDGAARGVLNANWMKFIAINCHGMKEKVESDQNVTIHVEIDADSQEEGN